MPRRVSSRHRGQVRGGANGLRDEDKVVWGLSDRYHDVFNPEERYGRGSELTNVKQTVMQGRDGKMQLTCARVVV